MKKAVKRSENYSQVCVWPGCLLNENGKPNKENIKSFEDFMMENLQVRIKFLEVIITGPDIENGIPVSDTGGRHDVFFAIHKDDVGKFAIPRFQFGIRWIEDVLGNGNYRSPIYPDYVFDYVTWNKENIKFP